MCSDVVIEVNGLGKCYPVYDQPYHRLLALLTGRHAHWGREFTALDAVSFSVHAGETVGIVGRNGSGKSTLLQMICGTLTPTSGQVQVRGRVAALLELGAGFNPEFSGIENIRLNASILGLSTVEIEARLDRILAFADIGEFVHQPVKTYSSGMFVRLAFAVVAHVDADVLVIDEALAVGDAFFTQKCMRFLRQFRDAGGTLLFVSHDPASVLGLCDRAIWLDHGRLRTQGGAKTVIEQYMASRYANEEPLPTPQPAVVSDLDEIASPPAEAYVAGGELLTVEGEGNFGVGGAVLRRVNLLDETGAILTVVQGGERINLRLEAQALVALQQPIFGFYIKDRLGQVLFGENSAAHAEAAPQAVGEGQVLFAEFHFRIPHLLAGDYVVAAAVGEGTQASHRIHHWVHDALVIRSQTQVLHGLLALPTEVRFGVGTGSETTDLASSAAAVWPMPGVAVEASIKQVAE